MPDSRVSFSDQVRSAAGTLGFDAVGIARASAALDQDFARYLAFVAQGMHGEMAWLARHGEVRERIDGDGILAGAKSIVCVARRYGRRTVRKEKIPFDVTKSIALYARGRDYHRFLRRRVRRLATFIRSLGSSENPVRARPICDEEPVLERAWAVRSGLGFIGKNGMLIVPGIGSMVLLAEVVTTLDLDDGVLPARRVALQPVPPIGFAAGERCGSCTRCLDACPTDAFSAPFVLDPRRCVSYLTIEHRSPIAPELRAGIGEHLFGCDDCQNVCPFNAGVTARTSPHSADGDPFDPLERWSQASLESMLSLDGAAWRTMFEGTPLRRTGRAGIARNAAIVLGNRKDPSALAALVAAASGHDDPVVREAAVWAVAQIQQR